MNEFVRLDLEKNNFVCTESITGKVFFSSSDEEFSVLSDRLLNLKTVVYHISIIIILVCIFAS